jgi:hypothetical protein
MPSASVNLFLPLHSNSSYASMLVSYGVLNLFACKDHFTGLQGVGLQRLTTSGVGKDQQPTLVYHEPVFLKHGFNGLVTGILFVEKLRR